MATPTTKTNTAEAAAKAVLAAKRKAQAEAEAEQAKLDELRRDVPPGIGEIEELEKAARTIRAKEKSTVSANATLGAYARTAARETTWKMLSFIVTSLLSSSRAS